MKHPVLKGALGLLGIGTTAVAPAGAGSDVGVRRRITVGGRHGAWLRRILLDPEDYWTQVREIDRTSRSRVGFITIEGEVYCVKVYTTPLLRLHQSLFRRSSAAREYDALALMHRDFDNALQPTGWGECRIAGFCIRSVLLTPAWLEATDGRQFRMTHATRRDDPRRDPTCAHGFSRGEQRQLQRLARDVIANMRRMHDAGIELRDCRDRNLLIEWGEADTVRRWTWIDLPRIRQRGAPLSEDRRIDDLIKLDRHGAELFSATDRRRLLELYFGDEGPADIAERVRRGLRRDRLSVVRRFFRWVRYPGRQRRHRKRALGVRGVVTAEHCQELEHSEE